FAGGSMFGSMTIKPVLPPERIFHLRFHSIARKPIWAFPPVLAPKGGALLCETFVNGALAQATASDKLPIRPGHLVMQTEHLRDALPQKGNVVREATEAPNVH